jgi:serine/threonine protein kinase
MFPECSLYVALLCPECSLKVLFVNDKFYFVMEYCESGCLTSLLKEQTNGRLPEDRARELLFGICEGECHIYT